MPEEMSHMFFELEPQEPAHIEKENSPETRKIKPALTIVAPESLAIEKAQFKQELLNVLDDAATSIDTLRSREIDYTSRRVYPNPIEIRMSEIRGTEHPTGWNGIVEGVGELVSDRRTPHTLDETYEYAQRLVKMARDRKRNNELTREIADIELAYYPGSTRNRTFLVDADGRSRIMVLKALEKSGCYVSISGIKVSLLE